MIEITLVQRLDDLLSWVPKALENFKCFFIYVMGAKVLRHCAVIIIGELDVGLRLGLLFSHRRILTGKEVLHV